MTFFEGIFTSGFIWGRWKCLHFRHSKYRYKNFMPPPPSLPSTFFPTKSTYFQAHSSSLNSVPLLTPLFRLLSSSWNFWSFALTTLISKTFFVPLWVYSEHHYIQVNSCVFFLFLPFYLKAPLLAIRIVTRNLLWSMDKKFCRTFQPSN